MAGSEIARVQHGDIAREDFVVSELASENPGSSSPFGEDWDFPLPLNQIRYTHPSAADRPHLLDVE